MFSQLYLGWSALRVAGAGLDVVGQNIANAANPDYHRQSMRQVSTAPVYRDGQWFGTGVNVQSITRARDQVLELAILENRSIQSRVTTHLSVKRHVETLFVPSEGGISGRIQSLFTQMDALSARPDDLVDRRQFVYAARDLAQELNRVSGSIAVQRNELEARMRGMLREVNELGARIVTLNQQITVAQAQGGSANTLMDQRDALVRQLSEYVDVEVNTSENFVLVAGGGIILGPNGGQDMALRADGNGQLKLLRRGDDSELSIRGGQLGGLIDAYQGLKRHDQQLDELASSLIRAIDQRHATGVGLTGSFSVLTSARRVANVHAPLASATLPVSLTAGQLTVTMTNTSTGERSLHQVAWDPAVHSLDDIATMLSTIPNLQATVNVATGQLAIFAQPGHQFDFTGGVATRPTDASGLTGTTQPRFSGIYTGSNNETFTFEASGAGEIGVTPGLSIIVRNSAGDVVQTLDVGAGYSPDTPLDVVQGVQIQFSAGTLSTGDSFTAEAIGNSDTGGILSGLAINTMFVGNGAHNLSVHPDLLADPRRLAASLSGQEGDGSNLLRMIRSRQELVADGKTATIEQFTARLISDIGGEVRQLNLSSEQSILVATRLSAERESVSGVNPDEELVLMLQYQRAFEVASRFIAAIRDTTAELVSLVG